jgi:hypothetical protein
MGWDWVTWRGNEYAELELVINYEGNPTSAQPRPIHQRTHRYTSVLGGKRPTDEYASAYMYRRRRIKKRRVVFSLRSIHAPYADTKIDK